MRYAVKFFSFVTLALQIHNESDFNALFTQHYKELCRLLLPMIKDRDAIEDIVQDVFLKVWIRRAELEIQTSFKAYLCKAVILRGIDHIRKEKTVQNARAELKILQPQSHTDVEENLHEKELKRAIEKGMDDMSENMRAIFHLSRFAGLKNREVAEQLGISIKTVESNMGKALKIMHEHLKPYLKQAGKALTMWLFCNF
jgi:RNA polymerase sigma-70 factor, ECF subfamily